MTRVEHIERAIAELSAAELADLRAWFADFEARQWDAQMEQDAASGALDRLADKAVADHRARRTKAM
jgi:hypothetical protein